MRWLILALCIGLIASAAGDRDAAALDSETVMEKPSPRQGEGRKTMQVHGFTNAPPGYAEYCRRNPGKCRSRSGVQRAARQEARFNLTSERWIMLIAVNSYVNDLIAPKTDRELHGVEEYWTLPSEAGDCEDYVLLKRRELMRRGWPESALLITVVLDEEGDGHAVLTVRTAQGDFVLDNKHSRVLLWRDVPYTFVKRQSYRSPQLWVSLTPRYGRNAVSSSGRERQ